MPKKKAVDFDVDKFLEETSKNSQSINDVAEEVEQEETRPTQVKQVEDVSTEDDTVVVGETEDRFAGKLVTQEPDPELEDAWQNEQEIDLGQYNARRIKTAREQEVKRIKRFQKENREQISNMMESVHGEEPATVEAPDEQEILSKKSVTRAREEKREAEKSDDNIVNVMMKELLGTYRE